VPVQYILQPLSEEEEQAFIFKDNVIRRHLTATEKQQLIERLYQDEISRDNRGGDRRSTDAKIKSSTELLISLPEKIEKETGIPVGTAKRILASLRKSDVPAPQRTTEEIEDKLKNSLVQFVRKNITASEQPKELISFLKKELTRLEKEITSKS
jgi:hypothetical protein